MNPNKYSHLKPHFIADYNNGKGMSFTAIGRKYGVKGETVQRYLRRSQAVEMEPVMSLSRQRGAEAIQPFEISALKAKVKLGDKVPYIKRVENENELHAVRRITRRGKVIGVYLHGVLADVEGEVVKRFITWVDILMNDRNYIIR